MNANIPLTALALATSLTFAHARDSLWLADSGMTPEQISPPWNLYAEAATQSPFWTNGALRIDTTGWAGTYQFFRMEGLSSSQPNAAAQQLAIPTHLVIEARMCLISGSSNSGSRAPAAILFTTYPGVGNTLGIDNGEIFLQTAGAARGVSANVDTTSAPHTYRIEVAGLAAGSVISVFYDGAKVLTGATSYDLVLNGDIPRIAWGDGTVFEEGVSDWYSFSHNALVSAPDERVLYGGIGNHLVTLDLTNGMAADLGEVAGIPTSQMFYGMAGVPDGSFYGVTMTLSGYSPVLWKINAATRQASNVGAVTLPGKTVSWAEGFDYNPADRQLYASVSLTGAGSESPVLVTLNPTNAVATIVCTVTNASGNIVDMDSIGFLNNTLYALDVYYVGGATYNTMIYTVDRTTGRAGEMIWFGPSAIGRFAFDRQTGRWFLSAYDARALASSATQNLYGAATHIGATHAAADFGGGKLLALAFPYDYQHPTPQLSILPGVQVGWPTQPAWNYQLEWCSELPSLAWTNLGPAILGDGKTNWVPDAPSAARRFYRVRVSE